MLKRFRERAGSEKGFTLIELLVVMLILGILAAIAIPAFLNQKNKANDASAKTMARTEQTAMETWSTDHSGLYNNPTPVAGDLHGIEGTIPAAMAPTGVGPNAYTVTATSSTNNTYSVNRLAAGTITHTCTIPGAASDHGGCTIPTGGAGPGTW
jgi:type IV pilus assembly protein PilA